MEPFNKLFLVGKKMIWELTLTENTGRSWGVGVGEKRMEVSKYLFYSTITFLSPNYVSR